MKIDFLIIAPDVEFTDVTMRPWPVARALRARGYSVAMVTLSQAPAPADDVPFFRIDADSLRGVRLDVAYRYGIHDLQEYAFCEYRYRQYDLRPITLEEVAARVPVIFAGVERILDEHQVGCVLNLYMGGEVLRRVSGAVSRERGIPVLWEAGTLYFPGRVLFVMDEYGTLPSRPVVQFGSLSKEDQSEIAAMVEACRAHPVNRLAHYKSRTFSGLVREFVAREKFREPRRIINAVKKAGVFLAYEFGKRYFQKPDADARFVYFPLHWPDESDMLIRSRHFSDQAVLCSSIGRMLPSGMELYVKPHRANPAEATPFSLIRSLALQDGVRVIDPDVAGHQLIEQSQAVITIFGTTGFEALLLRKPVVVLGRPAYSGWGVTTDVDSLDGLSEGLERAMCAPLSEEKLMDFLASFLSIHVRGDWRSLPYSGEPMADGVLEMVRRMRRGGG